MSVRSRTGQVLCIALIRLFSECGCSDGSITLHDVENGEARAIQTWRVMPFLTLSSLQTIHKRQAHAVAISALAWQQESAHSSEDEACVRIALHSA